MALRREGSIWVHAEARRRGEWGAEGPVPFSDRRSFSWWGRPRFGGWSAPRPGGSASPRLASPFSASWPKARFILSACKAVEGREITSQAADRARRWASFGGAPVSDAKHHNLTAIR